MDIAANNLLRQPRLRLCIWACRSKRAVAGHSVGGHWSIPRRRALSRRGSIRLRVWTSSTRVDRKLIQAVCDCTWTEWFGTRGLWRFLSRARSPSHQHCNILRAANRLRPWAPCRPQMHCSTQLAGPRVHRHERSPILVAKMLQLGVTRSNVCAYRSVRPSEKWQ